MWHFFAVKGNILYSKTINELRCIPNGYIVCKSGKVEGVYETLPRDCGDIVIADYGDKLIIPGLIDIHTHAPQYSIRGLGMDLELIDWLNQNTFPEEAKYSDLEYAGRAYTIFAGGLQKSAITRACIFGTIHVEATDLLMDLLEESGLKCMVGKVNMDRNSPEANINLSSGIAPVRTFLDEKIPVGLGTDMAAGSSNSILKAMAGAIQVSKLRWRLADRNLKPLTVEETFYLGTKGGGAFFGKVGSFEEGYDFMRLL